MRLGNSSKKKIKNSKFEIKFLFLKKKQIQNHLNEYLSNRHDKKHSLYLIGIISDLSFSIISHTTTFWKKTFVNIEPWFTKKWRRPVVTETKPQY